MNYLPLNGMDRHTKQTNLYICLQSLVVSQALFICYSFYKLETMELIWLKKYLVKGLKPEQVNLKSCTSRDLLGEKSTNSFFQSTLTRRNKVNL